jgi:hypothetical protein
LKGENFSNWKDKIFLTLGCMDMDLALHLNDPIMLIESSFAIEKWHIRGGSDLTV